MSLKYEPASETLHIKSMSLKYEPASDPLHTVAYEASVPPKF